VGLILAAISWQVKIQLWYLNLEKKTNYALCTLYDRTYLTSTLTFSPYGRILISGARDGKITFWDVYGKSQFHQLSGHEGAIDSLVLSSRGDRLLSTDRSNVVKIWEVR
jgi:WD40 repeat protein